MGLLSLPSLEDRVALETWCPIFTHFWLHELVAFLSPSVVRELIDYPEILQLVDSDDPSSRGRYINFWIALRCRIWKDVGHEVFIRIQNDGTLELYESILEEKLMALHWSPIRIYQVVSIERLEVAVEDEEGSTLYLPEFYYALSDTTKWAANCLFSHRMLHVGALMDK